MGDWGWNGVVPLATTADWNSWEWQLRNSITSWKALQQVLAGAKGFDDAVTYQHGPIRHQPERSQGWAALRSARQGQQLRGRMNEHAVLREGKIEEL